jgi:two-component system sensor histidine kinase BarA
MSSEAKLSLAAEPASDSILDKQISLAELVEVESFREVMRSFADLYRMGIKVFDGAGSKLVDIRVASGPFCGYLFEHGATRKLCTTLVTGLKNDAFDIGDSGNGATEQPKVVNCFSGLQYVVLPLHYEGDLMGRLIFGPYRPQGQERPSEQLLQIEPSLDPAKLTELIQPVRHAPIDVVSKVLVQLQRVVEVILFTSYRALLTSQMHIESVTASYQELQEKNRVLREANDQLKELDKMKSNFLATVSHELRTPLTSVIGYSEMLLEGMAGEMNEEQQEYVGTIMEKGESLLSLISQILDLSRVESGNLRLNKASFDVPEALGKALTSVQPQAKKKSIELVTKFADDLPAYYGDKEKVSQIAVNLLGNAVKFTPENGTIVLGADVYVGPRRTKGGGEDEDHGASALFDLDEERFLRLYVQDSGIGIPEDKLQSVFERFFQVDNSSTREYGGTGLGLSIVRSLVDGHGGEVTVSSEVGKGTTFTVLLPLDA